MITFTYYISVVQVFASNIKPVITLVHTKFKSIDWSNTFVSIS